MPQNSYPPPCNLVQRGLQKVGGAALQYGGQLASVGLVTTAGGIGIAGASASTVILAPTGVLVGGAIAEGGSNITEGGGIIGTGGALLMLAGGAGKSAVADLASRSVSHYIPTGFGRDLVGNLVDRLVNAIPFEFKACQ